MVNMANYARVRIAWASDPWATSPTFVDVTAVGAAQAKVRGIRRITNTVGRNGGHGGMFRPGTLVFEAHNHNSDWDEVNASSAFGSSNIRRHKRVQLATSANNFSSEQVIWTGFIDDIQPSSTGVAGTVTVTCVDLLKQLSYYEVDGLVRPIEFSGDRVTAILDEIGVPASLRNTIQNGTVLMPAATLKGQALNLLQQCHRAEQGALFCGFDGKIHFFERYQIASAAAYSTRQHSFTADGNGSTSAIFAAPVRRSTGGKEKVTRVTASSTASTREFSYDTTPANHPPASPGENPLGLQLAYDAMTEQVPLSLHKGLDYDGERVTSLTVRAVPGNTNALTAIASGLYHVLYRVEVQHKPDPDANDFNFEARIEGIQHVISDQGTWDVHLTFSPWTTTWADQAATLWYQYGTTVTASDLGAP